MCVCVIYVNSFIQKPDGGKGTKRGRGLERVQHKDREKCRLRQEHRRDKYLKYMRISTILKFLFLLNTSLIKSTS